MTHHETLRPIGQILRSHNLLTADQVHRVLVEQHRTGQPFGAIAERLFGLSPRAVEHAWAVQYAGLKTACDLDRQTVEPDALRHLSRRQAWQMQLLPLRIEDGALVMATTFENLPRAARFAWRRMGMPVLLMLARPGDLREHLQQHYPWPAMTDACAA